VVSKSCKHRKTGEQDYRCRAALSQVTRTRNEKQHHAWMDVDGVYGTPSRLYTSSWMASGTNSGSVFPKCASCQTIPSKRNQSITTTWTDPSTSSGCTSRISVELMWLCFSSAMKKQVSM
jgi:hypothetical protein